MGQFTVESDRDKAGANLGETIVPKVGLGGLQHASSFRPKLVGPMCQVQCLIAEMLRTKLVSCLKNSQLQMYRMVLNLQHVYMRKKHVGMERTRSTKSLVFGDELQLPHFMKQNGFECLGDAEILQRV